MKSKYLSTLVLILIGNILPAQQNSETKKSEYLNFSYSLGFEIQILTIDKCQMLNVILSFKFDILYLTSNILRLTFDA